MLSSLLVASFAIAQKPESEVTQYKVGKGHELKATTPVYRGSPVKELATVDTKLTALTRLAQFRKDFVDLDLPEMRTGMVDWFVTRSIERDDLISLIGTAYYDFGGAHPNRDHVGLNYGLVNGKARRLAFADLLKDPKRAKEIADQAVMPKLIVLRAMWVTEGSINELQPKQVDNFVITPAGITWLFAPYEMGSYAEGDYFVKVPWSELEADLRSSGPLRGLRGK